MPKGVYKHKPQQGFQKGHTFFEGGEKGWFKKGQPPPKTAFKKGENLGANHPNWKDGKFKQQGYVYIYQPNHPFVNRSGYIPEQRLVMEKLLKRYLTPEEVVHHINGIRDDNRIENLQLFSNASQHGKHHHPKGYKFGHINKAPQLDTE